MNTPGRPMRGIAGACLLAAAACVAGCAAPNAANIQLRKDLQARDQQIDQLKRQGAAAQARIAGLEAGQPRLATLPTTRLARLFTVHGICLGRLTGGARRQPEATADDGLRVYLMPQDEAGDTVKATGHVTVEAFDLSLPDNQRIGRWEFSPEQAKETWTGVLVNAFVFTLLWQAPPRHPDLTVKVTFRDELTGRLFTAQQPVKVVPPAR